MWLLKSPLGQGLLPVASVVVGSFVRKVTTASGATAVQIVHKRGRIVEGIDHIGSAHTDEELTLLLAEAREQLHAGQQALDLEFPVTQGRPLAVTTATVTGTASLVLWQTLLSAYRQLGFDAVGDDVFTTLVLARIIEPTSKLDTMRVLGELGIDAPSRSTITRTLSRIGAGDYRDTVARKCFAHARGRGISLVLYDVTTLYFEVQKEDSLRKPGMSKERRLDPQVVIGLLVDQDGFPLEIHCFEGNKAETLTMLPVIRIFLDRHRLDRLTVVTDAAMLSADNLRALEDAGLDFIVADRIRKIPYEIDDYIDRHGNLFTDGQTFEVTRTMGTSDKTRSRRVIYQYRRARERMDLMNINKQIAKAEKTIDGTRPVKKDRFVRFTTKSMVLDQALIDAARARAGIKGYVTNLKDLPATTVIDAYHALFEVERSFRMSKHDLAARPIYHRKLDSIEAHLTIVFTALAVARYIQQRTGLSIKKVLDTLRPLKSARLNVGGQQITAQPEITPTAQQIISAITGADGH